MLFCFLLLEEETNLTISGRALPLQELFMEENEIQNEKKLTGEELQSIIESKDQKALKNVFETIPDIDIAEAASFWSRKI